MTADAAITCDELTRSFGRGPAVDHLTLSIPTGSVVALLGHNGAGKTTTIRLLNGVLDPDTGSCRVLGLDPVRDGDELRRRTGVVTENAGLDDRLTARENLEITARLRRMSATAARATTDDLLERFGMADHADQLCRGFSTGQRRRLSLARALLHDPELLFLDEPTSGLDPTGARAVMDLINQSARERGRTVLLCTHFLHEAGETADLMAVMQQGRLLEFGSPAALAAARWPGLEVFVDTGDQAVGPIGRLAAELGEVRSVAATRNGVIATVGSRADIPAVVAHLVSAGISVYGTEARHKTLEDVYFAVQAEHAQPAGLLLAGPAATAEPAEAAA